MVEKKQTSFYNSGRGSDGLVVKEDSSILSDKRLWDVQVGASLLDVYVNMEIIDFLLSRIKQKNVRKYHNYIRLCSTFIAFSRE